ncbi:serine/threonine protein kinase [Aporhodopirellula aestuarii]|uniref:Serine/threonine protein kinase n=1 Tax=Aporhodopirellula aestuarii TaxID=2950107 RepID=A0ABT0U0V6_9BACT|nr:serine/threonine-protein kinase [Aporhodopirellula aestuarii]MCM2370488.1 serine/threonine protein kinase [Aporhodopirellula aestuarii]
MIATTSQCLSTTELKKLLVGELDADAFDSASEHVDSCARCQASIEELSDASEPLRVQKRPDPLENESACQFAIHRLLVTMPTGNTTTSQGSETLPLQQLGPYHILGHLGRGGMGTVCLAEHVRLKRRCAIKLLPPARVAQPGWLERFEREMAAVASLEHPGIVRANDAGTEAGWHYLVMEHLDGLDLARVTRAVGKLAVPDACEVIRQASLALAHVHGSGLVHRDIKPSNFMLTRSGTVKLLDLGLVLAGDDPLSCDDRLTTVGHLMGTLPAMSPEQLMDSRRVDASADIYSLGATLYRLISGRWPFSSDGGIATRVLAITSESPPPLATVQPDVDKQLSALVDAMMSRHPKHRPSADRVADEIQAWTSEANLTALIRRAEATKPAVDDDVPVPRSITAMSANDNIPPRSRGSKSLAGGFRAFGLIAAGMLLATVVIQIRADHGNVVVTTDGKDTRVEVTPDETTEPDVVSTKPSVAEANPERLYLGKNFQHWMDVFQREQQIEAIGQAMRAVELLSRGEPQRADAARVTLQLGNEYGTRYIDETPDNRSEGFGGSSSNPERFMGYLMEVFPFYLPEPGLVEIDRQLVEGTDKAKIAAIMLLEKYMDGVYIGTYYDERKESANQHIADLAKTDVGAQQLRSLLDHLGTAFESLKKQVRERVIVDASLLSSVEINAMLSRKAAWDTAIDLVAACKSNIDPPAWIAEYVVDEVRTAVAEYEARPVAPETGEDIVSPPQHTFSTMGGMGGYPAPPDWAIAPDVLVAALEMRREGRLNFPNEFVVDLITHPGFRWYFGLEEQIATLDSLVEDDPNALNLVLAAVDKHLRKLDSMQSGSERNSIGYSYPMLAFTGRLYAEHVLDIETAIQRFEKLESTLKATGYSNSGDLFQPFIEILEQRLSETEKSSDN